MWTVYRSPLLPTPTPISPISPISSVETPPVLPTVAPPEPEPKPEPEPEPIVMAVEEPVPAPDAAADVATRIAALEARVDEQDVALRRVLKLLVDWAEGEHSAAPPLPIARD